MATEHRTAWWISFSDRFPACVWGTLEEAERLATAAGKPTTYETLPYPARPRLDDLDGWDDKKGQCPSFCRDPTHCKGNISCPKRYSCTE